MEEQTPPQPPAPLEGGKAQAVHSAEILCEVCGRPTPHRILRLDPLASGERTGPIQGIARCRECRTTHRFRAEPARSLDVAVVLSNGPTSTRSKARLPLGQSLRVGEVADVGGAPLRVLRLDRTDGRSVREARVRELATVWATSELTPSVAVSIVEGRRTRSVRVTLPPDQRVEVEGPFEVEGRSYVVTAVRARGRTWRLAPDGFPAGEVDRVYVRRRATPPAGRRDWTREREIPSSSASSISRSARSRSSPGVTTARRRPRARSAAGGPAHQRAAPS